MTHAESHGPAGTPDDTVDKVSTLYAKKNGQLGMSLLAGLAEVQSGRVRLVVRGTDDGVWHRSFDGVSWGVWGGLGGVTFDAPAAVVFDGLLHVVVNGTDGGLWWCNINQPWQGISGEGTPTFATYS